MSWRVSNLGELLSDHFQRASLAIKSGDTGTTMIAVGAPYGQRLTGPVSLQCETSSPLIDCSLSSDSLPLPNDPRLVATSLLTITARPQVARALRAEAAGGLAGGGGVLALVILSRSAAAADAADSWPSCRCCW